MQPFKELDDRELLNKLNEGEEIENLLRSNGWKLVEEAMLRIVKQEERKLRDLDPNNATEIIRTQQFLKICDNLIPSIINALRVEGELSFNELGKRELKLTS